MKYGYARVSREGQSVDAQVRQLTKAGCKKVFRETASGAKTDRVQLRKVLAADAGDGTAYFGGNVGIGSTVPHARLNVAGLVRLPLNASAPATCSTSNEGAIALTHLAFLCVCDSNPAWHVVNTNTACPW
jgi:hypothetical protein